MGKNDKRNDRLDHQRGIRQSYEHNRRRILATQSVCGICGRAIDMSLKSPDPMSATVDHIIPISRGGDPVDMNNLQAAHRICNLRKRDKISREDREKVQTPKAITNRDLPLSYDWAHYKAGDLE